MQRINTINKATDLFGAGKHGYRAGNPAAGISATELSFDAMNAVQEEIAHVIEGSGSVLNAADNTQLYTRILAIINSSLPPVATGHVAFFAQATAPSGYLKANGAAISRTAYANLYAAIGTSYGVGDGATTFNVPDLRGEFIRGFDDGRGIDTGRVLGTYQAGMSQINPGVLVISRLFGVPDGNFDAAGVSSQILANDFNPAPVGTTTTMYPETRPRNIAQLACIKY